MGFFNKLFSKKEEEKNQLKEDLNKGLEKSRKGFFGKLATSFAGTVLRQHWCWPG